jgi:hypothetical protein
MQVLVYLLLSSVLLLDRAVVVAKDSKSSIASSASTSPFRTANYITHSLPQQCLTSSRPANVTVAASTTVPSIETAAATSSNNIISDTTIVATETKTPSVAATSILTASNALSDDSVPSSLQTGLITLDGIVDESPLEGGKFLSFEDWKRENLKKSGQSEHIGKGPNLNPGDQPRKRPSGLRDALDSFGDDAEIDLDFTGFVSEGLEPPQAIPQSHQRQDDVPVNVQADRAPRAGARSKDAGTTCKERFNYASFDCAADILKTNPQAKSASSILGENKDSYMLNECSADNKFLIIKLCDDISIDTIVLANFEFFSSTFRTFKVSVSDKYPVKTDKWKLLGTFEARNSREIQAFLIENPAIWARYVRIEFLTHYGNEFFCPLSLVRVHGTTMLEEYKHDLESMQDEDDEKRLEHSEEEAEVEQPVPEVVAVQLPPSSALGETTSPTPELAPSDSVADSSIQDLTETQVNATQTEEQASMPTSPAEPPFMFNQSQALDQKRTTCKLEDYTFKLASNASSTMPLMSTTSRSDASNATVNDSALSATNRPLESVNRTGNLSTHDFESNSTINFTERGNAPTSVNVSTTATSSNTTKSIPSSTQPPQPVPTMQESFFKSVQKRLQMLESNSSLSLQYIEDQSRALRDAFNKVEQRQLAKTTSFLDYLNSTVLTELREFRQQYDQLWQSTVIELEMQRERYQHENAAINVRLGILADEVIFQKRISFLQLMLIVVCLGLVLFSKGNLNSYFELPLVQNMLSRSPSSRFMSTAGPDTPAQSSPVSRSNSTDGARKHTGILKGHRRSRSEDSADTALSPSELYSPPTPLSFDDPQTEDEERDERNVLGDPDFDPNEIERPSTSPPNLPSSDSSTSLDYNNDVMEDSIDARLNSTPTRVVDRATPLLIVEDATPPSKHLKWQLPDG